MSPTLRLSASLLIYASFAQLAVGQSREVFDPRRLGRLRSEFGVPRIQSHDQFGVWQPGGDLYWTTQLFPVGAADRRYFVNWPMDKWPSDKSGIAVPQDAVGFLSYETKSGSKIKKVWSASLVPLAQPIKPGDWGKMGTLQAYLALSDLQVARPVSRAVEDSLKAVKGFAEYRHDIYAAEMTYGYVLPDGSEAPPGPESEAYGEPDMLDPYYGYPDTGFDYPTTVAEVRELATMFYAHPFPMPYSTQPNGLAWGIVTWPQYAAQYAASQKARANRQKGKPPKGP